MTRIQDRPAVFEREADGESWKLDAACRGALNPDSWHDAARSDDTKLARSVCNTVCPVRTECLAYALRHRITDGTWGGVTETALRALVREEHPGRHHRGLVVIRNGPRKGRT